MEKPLLPRRTLPPHVHAVDFVRWIGATHIVLFHSAFASCYDEHGHQRCEDMTRLFVSPPLPPAWARNWVQFFFLLSGFGAAYSHCRKGLASSHVRPWLDTRMLLRRLVSILPIYWACLGLNVFLLSLSPDPELNHISWGQVTAEAFLAQTWVPFDNAADFITAQYLPQGWYVSALAVCWLLEGPALRLAELGSRSSRHLLASGVCVALYIVLWPFARFAPIWGQLHVPYMYALLFPQLYLVGMLLAYTLHRRAAEGRPAFQLAFPIGAVGIVVILVGINYSWLVPRSTAVLGEDAEKIYQSAAWFDAAGSPLLPLFLLLITGLAEDDDPIAQWLNRCPRAAAIARDLSVAVYLAHVPALNVSESFLNMQTVPIALIFLVGVLLAHAIGAVLFYCLHRPIASRVLACLDRSPPQPQDAAVASTPAPPAAAGGWPFFRQAQTTNKTYGTNAHVGEKA